MTTPHSDPMVLEEENENENNNVNNTAASPNKRRRGSMKEEEEDTTDKYEYAPKAVRLEGAGEHDDTDTSWVLSPPPFQIDQRVFAKDSETTTTASSKQSVAEADLATSTAIQDACFPYYPAVIRNARRCITTGVWSFRVHYTGWNVRFDQWLSQASILSDTEENRHAYAEHLQRQKQQQQQQLALATTTTTNNNSATPLSARKRRPNGNSNTSSTTASSKRRTTTLASHTAVYEEYCELPFTLKTVLVEEWEKITCTGWDSPGGYDWPAVKKPARLVHDLPATVSVAKVVQHFEKKKLQQIQQLQTKAAAASAKDSSVPSADAATPTTEPTATNNTTPASSSSSSQPTPRQIRDFCQGMVRLFQDALPVCLLYPQERPQYETVLKTLSQKEPSEKTLADVYGCEFLLRLYVRLPVLLQAEMTAQWNTQSNNNNMNTDHAVGRDNPYTGPLLAELLVLLQKNRQACFKGHYRETKPEEWLDWERRLYSSGGDKSAATAAATSSSSGGNRRDTAAAVGPVAAKTTTPTSEGLEMDTR